MKELERYCKERGIDINIVKRYVDEYFERIFNEISKIRIPMQYNRMFKFLTQQYTAKFYRELKRKNAWTLLFTIIIRNALKNKEMPTSIFITTQTYSRGMGYYIVRERIGFDFKSYLEEIANSFYKLSDENLYIIICKGAIGKYLSDIIKSAGFGRNGFSFKIFNRWLPIKIEEKDDLKIKEPNLLLFCLINYILSHFSRVGYNDYAKIYFISKKLIYRRVIFFPNIYEIYKMFYEKEDCYVIRNDVRLYPKIAGFIFSMYIDHKDYREKISNYLGKIVNVLFNELRIDGKSLNEIMLNIIDYVKKEKKRKKISYMSFVLSKLYNNMDYKILEIWSEILGRYIMSEEYRKMSGISQEDSRRILERIIDEIKVEEMQGRFWNKLLLLIKKYNLKLVFSPDDAKKYLGIDIKRNIDITKYISQQLIGDKFYHVKSLIISGLLKSLR